MNDSTEPGTSALRRISTVASLGGTAGIFGGVALTVFSEGVSVPLGLAAGVCLGAVYGVFLSVRARTVRTWSHKRHAIGGGVLGASGWVLGATAVPYLLSGTETPGWVLFRTGQVGVGILAGVPAWVFVGALIGVLASVFKGFGEEKGYIPEPGLRTSGGDAETDVVVLGGGFAGITATQQLEKKFGDDPTVELTLVSDDNAVLFTPMLPEVAGGTLEPSHIYVPIRTSLRRTDVVQAEATDIDTDEKAVRVYDDSVNQTRNPDEAYDTVEYDHLVLALGAVPDYKGVEGIEEFSFDFNDIGDAITIRNHVVSCFETADRIKDPEARKAFSTFVVAGGGFSGAELAGALNDMTREMLQYYPNVSEEDLRVVVVHSRDRILPELSESLSEYALRQMKKRGIEFILGEYVVSADSETGMVCLESGKEIRTETLVWTAGNRPHPLVGSVGLPDKKGAVEVDSHLSVPGTQGVWAVGDCACVTDAKTGERHPATAQHAIGAAERVAGNVHTTVSGGKPEEHSYSSKGQLCVIGKRSACAEINGIRFSGFIAWLMWRFIYLMKLPGVERKARVAMSWFIELFFPRDIVQTVGTEAREVLREE